MTINFDIVIDTPDQSVDMKTGLDTMQGVSDATRLISEVVLNQSSRQRLSHTGKVRTTLKRNFKGSYGQIFSLDIIDEKLHKKYKTIGKAVFAELISYFINESLYKDSDALSVKAQKIVDDLGDKSEKLVKKLRMSTLENIHEVSEKFNHEVKIRYRKNRDEQTVLARFDKTTAKVLKAQEIDRLEDIVASITRLNIYTGNGRLLIKNQTETIAFSFGFEYGAVTLKAKKLFSENLHHNNGIKNEDFGFLKLSVKPVKLKDGKIIKYIIKGLYDNE